jgi:hypothetical protein
VKHDGHSEEDKPEQLGKITYGHAERGIRCPYPDATSFTPHHTSPRAQIDITRATYSVQTHQYNSRTPSQHEPPS